jgi:HEAT repeat protein
MAIAGLAFCAGCAGAPALSAARSGDRAALGAALGVRQKAGDLSAREAADLAQAVAERDLAAATGDQAVARVQELRACARELDGALAERMRTHDAAGAAAALARVEARGLGPDDVRVFAGDADPAWRAVGARGLVRPDDRASRTRALMDADPRVRRQAVRAARDAADPGDLAPLAEVARVDPEPVVRTEAVRAIAGLPPTGGDAVALALRDLWTAGDEPLRGDIAAAWAAPSVWAAGGRDALRGALAAERGPGALEAAAAVLRRRDADVEIAGMAAGQMARAMTSGGRVARLQAIAQATLERPELLAAVRTAVDNDDPEVRVSALARLAAHGDARARADLEALAQPGSPSAERARFALAETGDRSVQGWLEQDLAGPEPEDRLAAAVGLAALGVPSRSAPLLADASASVRTRAACTIVMGARPRR